MIIEKLARVPTEPLRLKARNCPKDNGRPGTTPDELILLTLVVIQRRYAKLHRLLEIQADVCKNK